MRINQIKRGIKFFRYNENEELEFIRVNRIRETSNDIGFKNSKGKQEYINFDKLTSDYNMLSPDGYVVFLNVELQNGFHDVIVTFKNSNNIRENNGLPDVICRQMVSDIFTNMTKDPNSDEMMIGISISQDTCPAGMDFNMFFACSKIINSEFIAVYLDDTLDDILRCLYTSIGKYNATLNKLKDGLDAVKRTSVPGMPKFIGYVDNLKDLLTTNNFMADLRRSYQIVEVPFEIKEAESLDDLNTVFLEKELGFNISATYLVKYTREINLNSIKRKYVLISSKTDNFSNVYIVGLDKIDGPYVERSSLAL